MTKIINNGGRYNKMHFDIAKIFRRSEITLAAIFFKLNFQETFKVADELRQDGWIALHKVLKLLPHGQ